jgi:hypothetical protein
LKAEKPTLSRFAGQPNRPVIIGGCPRSGTTLLRTMLHCHPEIAIPRETRFVLEAWVRRRQFGDLREVENRRRLGRWIFKRKSSQGDRLGLDPNQAIERLAEAPPTVGSLLATCFIMFAERHGKPRWGDKRPMYAAQIGAIWDLFPQAQFIHVVRDPRACVASLRKLGWYEGQIAPMVELWERSLNAVNASWPNVAGDQLLELKYEDLVTEPEATLARVAAFTRISGDDEAISQMLAYHEFRETRSQRYHANLERPLDPTRLTSWKGALAPTEIAFVETAAASLMRQWGYESVAIEASPPQELVGEFYRRRRRYAKTQRRLALHDRVWKLITYRHPLGAAPALTAAPVNPAASPGRRSTDVQYR